MSTVVSDNGDNAAPKATASKRSIAVSLNAILQARHANTRRKIKPRPVGPWMGEMIVVKLYDQMDSLRQILERPARIHVAQNGPAEPCTIVGAERFGDSTIGRKSTKANNRFQPIPEESEEECATENQPVQYDSRTSDRAGDQLIMEDSQAQKPLCPLSAILEKENDYSTSEEV